MSEMFKKTKDKGEMEMIPHHEDTLKGAEIWFNGLGLFILFGGLVSLIWWQHGLLFSVSSLIPFEISRGMFHSRIKRERNLRNTLTTKEG